MKLNLLFFLALLLCACNSHEKSIEAPARLIPPDTMGFMLRDIHLAEARTSKMNVYNQDSSRLIYEELERRVFKKYHIDSAVYRQNYRYYVSQPEQFAEIYKKVVQDLETRNQSGNIN